MKCWSLPGDSFPVSVARDDDLDRSLGGDWGMQGRRGLAAILGLIEPAEDDVAHDDAVEDKVEVDDEENRSCVGANDSA